MRTTPRSATALICFLSFFLFIPTSSVDSPTISKKSRVQASKENQDFQNCVVSGANSKRLFRTDRRDNLSKSYWMTVKKPIIGLTQKSVENMSNNEYKYTNLEINKDIYKSIKSRLEVKLLKKLKSSLSDSEWIINDETLKLLKNDPQRVIEHAQSGDRVLFALTGDYKFQRTIEVHKELELISKTPETWNNAVNNSTNTAAFTCPDSGPFLIVNSTFRATGFIINGCTAASGYGVIQILSGNVATFSNLNISCNLNGLYRVGFGAHLTLENSYFKDNHAPSGWDEGAVIYVDQHGHLTLFNCTFLENSARRGGAIYSNDYATITVIQSSLNDNHAQTDGGAIFFRMENDIRIVQSSFIGNNASEYGGVLYSWERSNINITDSLFKGNYAFADGGAVLIERHHTISISNCTFNENTVTSYGGALSTSNNNTIFIRDSTFSHNVAQLNGNLHFGRDTIAIIENCKLVGNNASRGGVMFVSSGSNILIRKSTFLRNEAQFGGCLYGSGSSIQVQDSKFKENHSSQSGGCGYFELSIVESKNNVFVLNKANEEGGAICSIFNSLLTMRSTDINSNEAKKGGGIALLSDSRLLCTKSMIKNNAADQGGGLYIEARLKYVLIAQLEISTFDSNRASSYGGGMVVKTFGLRDIDCTNMYTQCSRVLLLNTMFVNNTAITTGSILVASRLDAIVVGCDFSSASNYVYFGRRLFFLRPASIQSYQSTRLLKLLSYNNLCDYWTDNQLHPDAHGGEVATFGWNLGLSTINTIGSKINKGSSVGLTLENVKSGQSLPSIKITAIDSLGNTNVPTIYERDALLLSSIGEFLQQPISLSFTNGTSVVRGIISYVLPGNYTIQIRPREDDMLEDVNITIMVANCSVNEYSTLEGKYCIACDQEPFNFILSKSGNCVPCPKNAKCIRRYIIPYEGYWHKSPCNDKMKKCIVDEACKYLNRIELLTNFTRNLTTCNINQTTIEEYGDKQCYKGYEGRLCGSCKESYGSSSSFECLKCKHIIVPILTLATIACYLLFGASITIKGILPLVSAHQLQNKSRAPLIENRTSSSALATSNSRMEEVEASTYNGSQSNRSTQEDNSPNASNSQLSNVEKAKGKILETWKILLNFFQITSTATTMDIKWTSVVLNLLKKLQILGAATVNAISSPIDCIVSSSSHATKVIWRVVSSLLVPTIVLAILAFYWTYRTIAIHDSDGSYFVKRFVLSLITIVYITYFDLTQLAVRVFNCVVVHDDTDFESMSTTIAWIADTSIECYKSTHFTLVVIALVVLILVSIGFPLLCSFALFAKKEEVDIPKTWAHETLGLLSGPYKKRLIYWECITMIKKALLSIIIVFSYSLGNHAQGLLILLVLVFFLYIHLRCLPYDQEYHSLNYYESSSLLTSCLTYTLVQFFNVETIGEIFRQVISVALIGINGGFVLLMLFQIIKGFSLLLKAILRSMNIPNYESMNLFTLIVVYYKNRKQRVQGMEK